MVDIKEIKHIRAAPFTLMTSVNTRYFSFYCRNNTITGFRSSRSYTPIKCYFRSFITIRSSIDYSITSDLILL